MYVSDSLGVMSIGFMLPNQDDAVIWRGGDFSNNSEQLLSMNRADDQFLACIRLQSFYDNLMYIKLPFLLSFGTACSSSIDRASQKRPDQAVSQRRGLGHS